MLLARNRWPRRLVSTGAPCHLARPPSSPHRGPELSADVHVKPLDVGWEVRRHGERSASSKHNTRSSAVKLGRQLAMESKSELVVVEMDGTVTREQFADD